MDILMTVLIFFILYHFWEQVLAILAVSIISLVVFVFITGGLILLSFLWIISLFYFNPYLRSWRDKIKDRLNLSLIEIKKFSFQNSRN